MKVTRLKSGGFLSSGTDAGDLNILRTAKNIDDGSGMKAGGPVKAKLKKVISGLKKASKTHAGQAKTLSAIKMKKGKRVKVKKIPTVPMDDALKFDKGVTQGHSMTAHSGEGGGRVAFGRRKISHMKSGGKAKSKVNEAGNYTKPGMRKQIFNRIKAGGKGGRPGQWSARKAQMMAKAYKKAGGGYK